MQSQVNQNQANHYGAAAHSKIRLGSMGIITVLAILIIFVFNRAAAKIGIAPLYFLDLLIFINLLPLSKIVIRNITVFKYALFVAAIALLWLLAEYINNQMGPNNIRRTAMAVYLFVPALIMTQGRLIYTFIEKYSHLIALAILIVVASRYFIDLSPTVSSQALAFLLLSATYLRGRRWLLKCTLIASAFFLVASGVASGGPAFRTPVIGLLLALAVGTVSLVIKGNTFRMRSKALVALIFAGILSITVLVSFSSSPAVDQFLVGASGLLGVKHKTNSELANRERGDSAGTAETRTVFWGAIIKNSLQDYNIMFRGNGHFQSFFERTRPYEGFVDEDLLEPHNSFMGIYYRYGFLGLIPLLIILRRTMAWSNTEDKSRAFAVATYFLALNYCFFEVVLEGPHGAIIFWLMWLAPIYYSRYTKK